MIWGGLLRQYSCSRDRSFGSVGRPENDAAVHRGPAARTSTCPPDRRVGLERAARIDRTARSISSCQPAREVEAFPESIALILCVLSCWLKRETRGGMPEHSLMLLSLDDWVLCELSTFSSFATRRVHQLYHIVCFSFLAQLLYCTKMLWSFKRQVKNIAEDLMFIKLLPWDHGRHQPRSLTMRQLAACRDHFLSRTNKTLPPSKTLTRLG